MSNKRHPLDVFRSTDQGFASASRETRRKITGKVLTSSTREGARPVPAAKVKGSPSVPRLSPAAFDLLRKGGLGAAALGVVVVAVLSIHTLTSDAPPELAKEQVLGPGRVEPPAHTVYTIRASLYSGTAQAGAIAWEARTRLVERGFPDVLVLGWPDPEQPEIKKAYELVVGSATSSDALAELLADLRGIDDWPGGRAAPFTEAYVDEHPMPEALAADGG